MRGAESAAAAVAFLYEDDVVHAVVRHLKSDGWTIESFALSHRLAGGLTQAVSKPESSTHRASTLSAARYSRATCPPMSCGLSWLNGFRIPA